jgi:UTP--glucose-1-phosphate uridylyltransferase
VPVRRALFPAAGLGTRFLPATKVLPKEMIPVIDMPAIQYAVEEAVRAGIDDVLIVTSSGKVALEDHFDRAIELEGRLEGSGKSEELAEVTRLASLAQIHSVRQKEPLGLGHAVMMGKHHVGAYPVAVILPDEIVPAPIDDEIPMLERMIEIYESNGASVIGVQEVSMDDISSYGVVAVDDLHEDVGRITGMVEKPARQDAPSNLRILGRYVLSPRIFAALEETEPGVGDEIQLTDGIKRLIDDEGVFAYVHRGPIYDVGKKLDYLRATVELALRREDLGKEFREFLDGLIARLD